VALSIVCRPLQQQLPGCVGWALRSGDSIHHQHKPPLRCRHVEGQRAEEAYKLQKMHALKERQLAEVRRLPLRAAD
jgi:hypothetical protein